MEETDNTCTYEEHVSTNRNVPLFICSKCGQIAFWTKPTEGVCPTCGRTIVKEN